MAGSRGWAWIWNAELLKIPDMNPADQVFNFAKALPHSLGHGVLAKAPTTLAEAINQVRIAAGFAARIRVPQAPAPAPTSSIIPMEIDAAHSSA